MIIAETPKPGDDFELRVTLVPHRSMSWHNNKITIIALSAICLGIALLFTLLLDTWMILPFAGLEIFALATALYYVSWKLSYRHIITVYPDNIRVDKGVYRPRKSWLLSRTSTNLKITPPKHEWEPRKIELISNETVINIGQFLHLDDIEKVISLLSQELFLIE